MLLKDDFYAIYNGKEYRVSEQDGYARLVSNDPVDLNLGFSEKNIGENLKSRIFVKLVSPPEVCEVYDISTYALYKGFEFPVIGKNDQGYILFSGGYSELMDKLEFSRTDKYGYEKIVEEENLDLIYEKKTLITDFFD